MATQNEKLKFSSGRSMPAVGLGTFSPLQGEEEITLAVKAAVKHGYRQIDCAAIYGNERAVGLALKELFSTGVVKREDLFITSKLWGTCHRPDLVLTALEKTLEDLGVDYVDLYLIHWPMAFQEGGDMIPTDKDGNWISSDVDFVDTWKALEDCQDMGKTKDLGLSNFNSSQINRVLEVARVSPVALEIEVNCHMANTKLIEFATSKGFVVIAYAPLGSPSMGYKHTSLLMETIVQDISKAHGKTPAQVVLRFLLQRGLVVIPKSVTESRIEENIGVFDFGLSDEDMTKLASLNKGFRGYQFNDVSSVRGHKYFPFNEEF